MKVSLKNIDSVLNTYNKRIPKVIKGTDVDKSLFNDQMALDIAIALLDRKTTNFVKNNLKSQRFKLDRNYQDSNSLLGLLKRIKELNPGEMFTYGDQNLHEINEELYQNIFKFLQPLQENFGYPNNGANTIFQAGYYKFTLAGIHTDPCDVFLMPILGKKKVYTWPKEKFCDNFSKKRNGSIYPQRRADLNYQDFLDEAEVLEAFPGDIMFIPAGTWHINVYDDTEYSASFGTTIFRDSSYCNALKSLSKNIFNEVGNSRDLKKIKNNFRLNYKLYSLQKMSRAGLMTGLVKRDKHQSNFLEKTSVLYVKDVKRLYDVIDSKTDDYYLISNGVIIKTKYCKKIRNTLKLMRKKTKITFLEILDDLDDWKVAEELTYFLLRTKYLNV